MKEVTDVFMTSHEARKVFYQDILVQNSSDPHFDVEEVSKFRMAMLTFENRVQWMFDHNYNEDKILRLLPAKVLKTLNHTRGASMFILFDKSLRKDYKNEQRMIEIIH